MGSLYAYKVYEGKGDIGMGCIREVKVVSNAFTCFSVR